MSVMTKKFSIRFCLFLTATWVWNGPFEVCFQEILRKQTVQKILRQRFARSSVKNALDTWCQLLKLSYSDTLITWLIKWGWVNCILQITFKMLRMIPFVEVHCGWMWKFTPATLWECYLQHKWMCEQYVCTGANFGMFRGNKEHRGSCVNKNLNLPSQAHWSRAGQGCALLCGIGFEKASGYCCFHHSCWVGAWV